MRQTCDNGVAPAAANVAGPRASFGPAIARPPDKDVLTLNPGLVEPMTSKDPWRVGVLFSSSGPTAAAELSLRQGTRLAIEKINRGGGVQGREIFPVEMDPGSDEARFRELSHRMTEQEGISVIFGGYTSAGRKAMIPNIERSDSLLFYPTFYEGFEYSDHVFYFGACPNQYIYQLVDYILRNLGSSIYLVGANYVFPRESNRIVKELVKQAGGRIMGERYLRLDSRPHEAERIVREIEKKKPEVVFSTLVGDHVKDFYTGFDRTDLRQNGVPIASIVTTETEIDLMGVGAARGHYCAGSYFEAVDTSANREFLRDFQAKFGNACRANSCAEAAFNQVMVFTNALRQCGTMDAGALREVLLGSQFAAPQGDIRIDAENHHAFLWSRVGRVGVDGTVEIVDQSPRSVAPDPYLINYRLRDLEGLPGSPAAQTGS